MAKRQHGRHQSRNQVKQYAQSEDRQEEGGIEQHLYREGWIHTACHHKRVEQVISPLATCKDDGLSQCQSYQSAY